MILALVFIFTLQEPTTVIQDRSAGIVTPETVVLIIDQQEQLMTVAEAEKLLKSDETHLRAAATIAIGTLPEKPKCITWEQHVAEVTCWHCAPERVYADCDSLR
jgi:hypothetical protein